jgi:CubicO group peptidase (beta-lactamase class C family)
LKRRSHILAALVLPIALSAHPTWASPSHARDPGRIIKGPLAARIDSFMTFAADLGLSGTLLVEKDGEVILHRGYGIIDRVGRTPARTDTPYLLGSLSKQFTATAAYKLESQGKLHLTDPLPVWFSNVPSDKRGITVDQLIHHTSGLPYLGRGDLYDSTTSIDSMVGEILSYPLDAPPGAKYEYSSPGYNLLARIVERAARRSLNEVVASELFRSAGMTHTGFADEPSRWPAAARTPSYSSGDPDPDTPLYPVNAAPKIVGAGSVVSTTGDLWKWELALRSGRVLDAEATRKLFAPGPAIGQNAAYAGGWLIVRSQRATTVIMHAGDIGGFNADMRRMVDEHATIIFLSNGRESGRGYRDVVSMMVTRILFGPPPELPRASPPLRTSELASWNGSVTLAPGVRVESRVRDGAVWLTARDQEGMFRISGADSVARLRALELNQRAAWVADSLLHGGSHSLDSTFSPSLVEASHPEFFRVWRTMADSVGGAPRADVLGTVISSPGSARTFVRLKGARSTRTMTLEWLEGRLVQSTPVATEGLRLRFMPDSRDRLTRYDLWSARTIRVERSG